MISAGHDYRRMLDYIVGRLSEDESRAFEDRLLKDPHLVRELEDSLRLREGLQRLRGQGYLAKAAPRSTGSRIWLPALAAAACAGVALFLGVYGGTWVHRGAGASPLLTASPESGPTGAPPSIAARFTFVSVRGGSTPDLDLPSAGLIEFRAAPASRAGRYRVTLLGDNSGKAREPLGTLSGVAVSTDGYVHGYADVSRLQPGSYRLRLEPDTAVPGAAEIFPFSLRARGAAPSP